MGEKEEQLQQEEKEGEDHVPAAASVRESEKESGLPATGRAVMSRRKQSKPRQIKRKFHTNLRYFFFTGPVVIVPTVMCHCACVFVCESSSIALHLTLAVTVGTVSDGMINDNNVKDRGKKTVSCDALLKKKVLYLFNHH